MNQQACQMMDQEAMIRLCEGIFSQLSKDYIHEYELHGTFNKGMENYIRVHPLTCFKAEFIIENLRTLAKSRKRLKYKTHRVRVGKVEV